MNLAVHNPEFSDGYSITELLIWVTTQANQIVTQASQLVSKDKQIVDLTSQNADLTKQIVDLTKKKTEIKEQFTTEKTALLQRIEELERSATLDSTNSCKPPSSDGLRKSSGKKDKDKKKRTKSSREKSGRKSGGQPGHKGNTLKQVDNPDEIINILPEQCPNCQTEFSLDDSEDYVRRQVFDVPPPPPPVVTEHRAHICKCKGCGEEFKGEFPANVTAPVQYGERVAAIVVYNQTVQVMPVNRTGRMLSDIHGMDVSQASIMKMVSNKARELESVADVIQKKESSDPLVTTHLDETGFRAAEKLQWVHNTSTKTLSHFRVGSSRGDVLIDLVGNIMHDCFSSYWKIEGVIHGVCNFHTTRELKALFEIDNEEWAGEMRTILFDALELTHEAEKQGKKAVDPEDIIAIKERYYTCLKKAIDFHEGLDPFAPPCAKKKPGRQKKRIGHNLCLRLLNRADCVLLFLHDLTVPFTNNEAERDLRMTKVRQKVSGCFRTVQGLKDFCTLRSIIETARKQGWDVLEILQTPPDKLIQMIKAA